MAFSFEVWERLYILDREAKELSFAMDEFLKRVLEENGSKHDRVWCVVRRTCVGWEQERCYGAPYKLLGA